ncbi:CaiB/BaiF CoA transferase family protein [Pelotomaculum propionicicum]|uniref:Cinnamoyl-CoA:phenyllactate CoA-transferase n=1 Tax=Pelotomaculum propionicicum TaxID=258475 RepID=A0A4Y7RJC0_9FIRM|nr:CaiB/BaiF CoA-transferase family protein [Pelotomaculum propionicicum]TEB09108.1 Cinnamoyl-CoA:phenyllactate CoA-transferase [Pelotomaculum propionicicum]
MMNQPLKGVKVIDLTTFAAGPATTKILADWGADVIKIEPPEGDITRIVSGNDGSGIPYSEEIMPTYELINGNKRSLALDLKSPEGKEVLDKLLTQANCFVTNFRTKALKKLGLDYETVSQKYPHIVWARVSGYGELGPLADDPGFDIVAFWARSGLMIDITEKDTSPVVAPFAFGDLNVASTFAGGICAALYNQAKTGKGDKVMISLYAQAVWGVSYAVASTQFGQKFPKSRKAPGNPLINSYKSKDGDWVYISVLQYERYWGAICKIIGREDLINDSRYCKAAEGFKNTSEVVAVLDEGFARMNMSDITAKLMEADIAFDKIRHFSEIIHDPQALANSYVFEYAHRNKQTNFMSANPLKFGTTEAPVHRNAPLIGEHSREVLKEAGYPEDKIAQLIENKIVAQR